MEEDYRSPQQKIYYKDKADLRDIMSSHEHEDKTEHLLYFIAKQLIEIKYQMK